ncbi:sulfate ABC transporter permease subunit CysT [Umezakia ovalisporum]|uniref:Sulfate transport system permease protein CysT n=2 Tax=Umezakia ovalisporum TaxID=75695 RepID=A0AA43KGP8_9CYAN|nr:sulfate ABC transporter permease subunit CysT [Umezakia ovalisporum]MDH6058722.1 sulfate ABC transporter permease subunit CysT [Umezakia ovalisporum FSS-43]MDH6065143.1 sulfate ABC transporter permease subunit CysT [Umezakia ovalisporum FSS-62]MDH6069739.1 sulfate ABC transporter permease subunit CysT [Umezakia ovalisporum CobakiLakeA]MDH6074732.1 sulfate ABC transporter permease subunit CysT [Umezakia ovalisporum CS-1034]MDH6080999.1 sulfate ABC transporter permease subunit CysT [Umezakia 
MTVSNTQSTFLPNPKNWLKGFSLPWGITITYLSIVLLLPVSALILRAATLTPGEFWRLATAPVALSTYNITFGTAFFASAINCVAGTATAWVLVRYDFPLKRVLNAVIDLPFALPTAVAGITLSTVYSEQGWIGSFLAPLGMRVSFTRLGVAVAMVFISVPFVVRSVQPVLQELDHSIEEAAWSLGASQWETCWRVVLPPLIPAILTGTTQAFARAVGEYGSVVLIASNIPYRDLIAPILVFQRLEQNDIAGATAIATVLLVISLVLLLIVNLLQAWRHHYEG